MQERDLQHLLRNADRQAGPPPEAPPLTVRQARKLIAQRQRRSRAIVGATTVVLLLGGGTVWRATGVSRSVADPESQVAEAAPAPTPTDVAETDLAALAAEADFHALVARRMIAALRHQQALEAWQKERALGDPIEQIHAELDKTAFRMIARADGIIEQMGERATAIAIYKDVIRLFPKTLSAGVAHDRLAKIDQPQGDT